jgi:hypothetical protein
MCLTTLTHGPNPAEEGEGYKVFRKLDNGELQSVYVFGGLPYQYPANTWITDTKDFCLFDDEQGQEYQTGFHLFANQKDAELKAQSRNDVYGMYVTHVVRKVKFRNVTAKGTDDVCRTSTASICSDLEENYICVTAPVVVAKEIFVEERE